jgi:hypothetical protein
VPEPPDQPETPDQLEPPDRFVPPESGGPPVGLDYFAANQPDRRQSGAVVFWSVWLGLGWVPYACGVVNGLVVAQSSSPAVTRSHNVGAALFMGLGIFISAAGLIGFASRRHWTGVAAAFLLLGVQASVAACFGLSSL